MIDINPEILLYVGGGLFVLFVVLIVLNSIFNRLSQKYQAIGKSYVMMYILWSLLILSVSTIIMGVYLQQEQHRKEVEMKLKNLNLE